MNANNSLWRGRRVLVTGCTGFLGGAVTRELLDRGAIVAGLVRTRDSGSAFAREQRAKQFHVVHGRVEDTLRLYSALAVHEVAAIFHMVRTDPFSHDVGTNTVLRAAALYHSKVPVIIARPADELRLVLAEETAPVPLGTARFGELFGGGDRKSLRVVPRSVQALLAGERATGSEGATRDFVPVRDAARACVALAETVGAEAASHDCTFRTGWEFSERGMAGVVSDVFLGKTPTAKTRPVSNPFEWTPQVSLTTAVEETISWYRDDLQARRYSIQPTETRHAA